MKKLLTIIVLLSIVLQGSTQDRIRQSVARLQDLNLIHNLVDNMKVSVTDTTYGTGSEFIYKPSNLYGRRDTLTGICMPVVNVMNNLDTIGYWIRDIGNAPEWKVSWVGVKPRDTADAGTAQLQALVDYVSTKKVNGNGTIRFDLSGIYTIGTINIRTTGLSFFATIGTNNGDGPSTDVTLRLKPGVSTLFSLQAGAASLSFIGLGMDGVNGDNFYDSTMTSNWAIRSQSGGTSGIYVYRCKIRHFSTGIEAGAEANWTIDRNSIRNNNTGVRNMRDGSISNNYFSANRSRAIYLNNGQVDIQGNFIEFTGNTSGAPQNTAAIFLDGNCARITVLNNRTDRNQGKDIVVTANANNTPGAIQISGNQFKRAAWADSMLLNNQEAIYCVGVRGLKITDNYIQTGGNGASNLAGRVSPYYIAWIENCIGVDFRNNSGFDKKIKVSSYAGSGVVRWTPSIGNPNAYRFLNYQDNLPWQIANYVGFEYSQLTFNADPSTLTTGQWSYGDIDSLGFGTYYIRLAGDADPRTISVDSNVYLYYEHNPVVITGCTNVITDEYRNINSFGYRPLMGGASSVESFETGLVTIGNRTDGYKFVLYARERTTNQIGQFIIPFNINRGTGNAFVVNGGIQALTNTGLTLGWDSNSLLQISLKSDIIGYRIRVNLTNTSVNQIDYRIGLLW